MNPESEVSVLKLLYCLLCSAPCLSLKVEKEVSKSVSEGSSEGRIDLVRNESTEKDEGRRIVLGVIRGDSRDGDQGRPELGGRLEEGKTIKGERG